MGDIEGFARGPPLSVSSLFELADYSGIAFEVSLIRFDEKIPRQKGAADEIQVREVVVGSWRNWARQLVWPIELNHRVTFSVDRAGDLLRDILLRSRLGSQTFFVA